MSGCTKRQAWLNISRGSHSLFVFTLLVFLKASTLPQKLRQFRHVGRNPPSLIFCEQLGRRSSARLILEIDIGERLPGMVARRNKRPVPRRSTAAGSCGLAAG
jgi:hypothetical protein